MQNVLAFTSCSKEMSTMKIPQREHTKQRILKAAIDLFEEHGYDNVTVRQIADEVGVSQMTFFRNFPSRATLLENHVMVSRLTEHIPDAPAQLSHMHAILWALSRYMSAVTPEIQAVNRRVIGIVARSSRLRGDLFGADSKMETHLIDALIERGAEEMEARISVGAFLGAASSGLKVLDSDTGEHTFESLIHPYFSFLLGGLGNTQDLAEGVVQEALDSIYR